MLGRHFSLERDFDIDETAGHHLSNLGARRLTWICLAFVIFISSLPVLVNFIPYAPGHDHIFHFYRIDGIAEGLRQGQFPVTMQTKQVNGFGYPVSVCYGDLFLYIPAILRLIGCSMHLSYGIFIVIVNTFCAIMTYLVASRAFQSRSIALLVATVWTLAPYRLLDDMYLRGAVGEYLALCFFPIISYGIYSIFYYDMRGASRRGFLWCSFGVAGVVYSHILSVLLGLLLFLPILVVLLVFRHKWRVVKGLLLSVVLSLLLCSAFLIPFFDYYLNADMKIAAVEGTSKRMVAASHAIQPIQLFFLFPDVAYNSLVGLTVNEMPFNLGYSIIACGVLSVCIVCLPDPAGVSRFRIRVILLMLLVWAIALAWMCTLYFPWGAALSGLSERIISLIATIQFPWRIVGTLSFLLVLLGGISLAVMQRDLPHHYLSGIIIVIVVVSVLEASSGITSFISLASTAGDDYSQFDGTGGVMNGEYLPEETDLNQLLSSPNVPVADEGIVVADYIKNGSCISMEIHDRTGDGGRIQIPLLSYPNYILTGDIEGASLEKGNNGLLSVLVPAGSSGKISITYVIPPHWVFGWVLTWLTLALVFLFLLWGKVDFRRVEIRRRKRIVAYS